MRHRRFHVLWLGVPYLLFLGALPLVNRVRPVVFGLPFLFLWLLIATLITPLAIWFTWRGDKRGRGSRNEGRGEAR
ncbi:MULTISPECIES: DUF3311 domain-containing protein [unclassified Streptomyces]|uniref:DUF3311 domain-containing protein n=1 Tax=unclassified Streptomyces TaxID=2593676 RepID=UPI0037F626CA